MTDERRDDEIVGRALSRAIETIDVNQTPFERSRIATAPARRSIFGPWQIATAAAAIVLALAIGSWLTRPIERGPGVAASPTAPLATATAPTATNTPAPTATPAPTRPDHDLVYFARDGLPPVAAHVDGISATSTAARISARLAALSVIAPSKIPPGAVNAYSAVGKPSYAVDVSAQGDVATVEFDLPSGWGVRGAAQSQAVLQQLVYTITEEPGIRSARIVEKGKPDVAIDQLLVDKPLAREDVFGYGFRGAVGKNNGISFGGNDSLTHVGARLAGYDIQDGTRATLFLEGRDANGQKAELPSFDAWLEQSDDTTPIGAKYTLYVQLQWNGGGNSNGAADVRIFDRTPLRAVTTNGNNVFRIELDDARPWRVSYIDKSNVSIEIGGGPRMTSDRIAVYRAQAFAATPVCSNTCDVQLSGAARVFEANVVWRVKDTAGKAIANGHFLASLGSSAVWGTFDTSIQVPPTFRGNATLELYEASAKDGSEQGVVQIPLVIR